MKTLTHIVSLIMIVLLCTSGLPLFSPEDASRDGRVDLRDAVLLVQDLAVDAEADTSFFRGFVDLVNAVRTVAGLRSEISQPDEPTSAPATVVMKDRHDQTLLPGMPFFAASRGVQLHYPEPLATLQAEPAVPALPPPEQITI